MLYLITLTSLLISVKSQAINTCAFTPPNPCPDPTTLTTVDEICCVVNNGGSTSGGDVVLVYANECYAICNNAENKLPNECGTCCSPNASPSQCITTETCTQLGNFAYCQASTTTDPCAGECDDSANPCAGRTGQLSTCEINQADTNKCRQCIYECDTSNNYCALSGTDCDRTLGLACQQQTNSPYCGQCTCTSPGWCIDSNSCTISPNTVNTECVRVNSAQQCGECMDPCRNAECQANSECTGGLTGQSGICVDDTTTGCKKCEYTTTCDTTTGVNCQSSNHCTISPNTECVFSTNNCGECMDPCRNAECKGDSECIGGLTGQTGTCTGQTTSGCKTCEYTTTCDTTAGYCLTPNDCTVSPNTECVFFSTNNCGECMDPCRNAECKGDSECIGGLTGEIGRCIDDSSTGCTKCAYECDTSSGYFPGDGNCNTGETCVFETTPGGTSQLPCCICQDVCANIGCNGDSECTSGTEKQKGTCSGTDINGCSICIYSCDSSNGIYCKEQSDCISNTNTECVYTLSNQICGDCMDPCRNAECQQDGQCQSTKTGEKGICNGQDSTGCKICQYECDTTINNQYCNVDGNDCTGTGEECIPISIDNTCGRCTVTTCDISNNYCAVDNDCTGTNDECVGAELSTTGSLTCGICMDRCRDADCREDNECQNGLIGEIGTCTGQDLSLTYCKKCDYICSGQDSFGSVYCIGDDDCDVSSGEKCTWINTSPNTACGICQVSCDNGCANDADCTGTNEECVKELTVDICGICMDGCRNQCTDDSGCTLGAVGTTATCDIINTNTLACNQCVYSCTNGCKVDGDDCATPEECVSNGVTNSVCGECQCKTCEEDVDCTTTAGIIGLCVDKNVNGCGVCKDICYDEECAQDANCETGFECNADTNGCGVCEQEGCIGDGECVEDNDCDTSIPEKCSGVDDTTCGKCETDNCPNGCEVDNDCATGEKCEMSSTAGTLEQTVCGECVFDDGSCYDDSECDDGYSCRFDHWFGCTPRDVSSVNGVVPTTMCQGICVNNGEYCDAVRVKDYWPCFWKNSGGIGPNGASSDRLGNLCEFCLCTEIGERKCEYVVTWENVAKTLGMDVTRLVELFNKKCNKDQFTDLKDENGDQCDYINVGVKDVEDIKECGCTVFYCKGGTYVSINGANQLTIMVGIVFVMVMFWWM